MPDPFERCGEECGLRLTPQPLGVAPRDVLLPVEAAEQHFLVELTRPGTSAAPVRLIFVTPLKDPAEPRVRDVLWWLASDAWVLEQGESKLELWAAVYGYPRARRPPPASSRSSSTKPNPSPRCWRRGATDDSLPSLRRRWLHAML